MRTWLRLTAVLAAGLAIQFAPGYTALAQQPGAGGDEAAVRKAGQDYLAAIERGDAGEIAQFWTAEGTYTDATGKQTPAREAIDKNFTGQSKQRSQMQVSDVSVRFVTPDVALEEGTCETTPPGAAAPITGRFAAVWVRQNGRWKLDSLREAHISSSEASAAQPAAAERLAVLEPFVGEWSGSTGKLSMQVSARWNSGQTFLRREISISSEGKERFSSTQFVGWDPVAGQIRSWQFNGDGGYGEGMWDLSGNSWMMLSSGTLPEGGFSSATQVFKFTDRNTMVWTLLAANAQGQSLPGLEVKLSRKSSAR